MSNTPPTPSSLTPELAAEAFLYGYPLVYGLQRCGVRRRRAASSRSPAPCNAFGHARDLVGPELKFVSPNNDTLYSIATSTCGTARSCCTSPTPAAATTCCSSSTRGRTTSPTSVGGPPARRRPSSSSCRRGYDGRRPRRHRASSTRPTGVFVDRRPDRRWTASDDLPAVHALQDGVHADAPRRPRRRGRRRPSRDPGAVRRDRRPRVVGDASASLLAGVPAAGRRRASSSTSARGSALTDAESPFVDPDPAARRRARRRERVRARR